MSVVFKILPYFILFVLYLLPSSRLHLADLTGSMPGIQYKLILPAGIFEPFTGIGYYFLSFFNMKLEMLSWVLWVLVFIMVSVLVLQRKNILQFIKVTFLSFLFFLVFVSYLIFFPLPKYRIVPSSPDIFVADLHSHTDYSHDGLAGAGDSIKWHIEHGFNGWFITDHEINGAVYTRELAAKGHTGAKIFTGEEVRDKYGNALLSLGLAESVSGYSGRETREIVKAVHGKGGAVLVAHWWGRKGSRLSELGSAGVDGFEIFGHTSPPLDAETHRMITEFCRKNKLIAAGGSNWHGLGSMNDVWTCVRIPGWQKYDEHSLEREIVRIIRCRETGNIDVFSLSRNQPQTVLRFIFEPYVGLFLYFTGLNLKQTLIWAVWITVLFWGIRAYNNLPLYNRHIVKSSIYFLFAVIMLSLSAVLFFKWKGLVVHNRGLFVMSKAHLVIGIIFLSLAARKIYGLKQLK